MEKIFKFNNRAQITNEDYYFKLKIIQTKGLSFLDYRFLMLNSDTHIIDYINLNEWKIKSITASRYFGRKTISISYIDPTGDNFKLNTGGRKIDETTNSIGIIDMGEFVEEILTHFFKLSCFENVNSVIEKRNSYLENGSQFHKKNYNHTLMTTYI